MEPQRIYEDNFKDTAARTETVKAQVRVTFDFGEALKRLKAGAHVTRLRWNGQGQYVGLQSPDERSANTLPYLWIRTVQGFRVPWVASQADLLETDWAER